MLSACHRAIEPQVIAGYIAQGSGKSLILINHPDSTSPFRIILQEDTEYSGGVPIVGNLAEVIYLPATEENPLPIALSVTADKTYPQALGKWVNRDNRRLEIAIELLPYGHIEQSEPSDILTYTSWHLTDQEDIIELCGTLSLPPERSKKEKKINSSNDTDSIVAPQRRLRSFRVTAELLFENNNKVMIITTDKGQKSKLHFVE